MGGVTIVHTEGKEGLPEGLKTAVAQHLHNLSVLLTILLRQV